MNAGIAVLPSWDLLLEYARLGWPVLRLVAWCRIGGTVAVNVMAARSDVAGVVMRAAPVLFIVMEGVRHLCASGPA